VTYRKLSYSSIKATINAGTSLCQFNCPSTVKRPGKFASFTIKERQSLPVFNRYLIVFYVFASFLDWKNGAE